MSKPGQGAPGRDLAERFLAALRGLGLGLGLGQGSGQGARLGLAVSGGGDSLAMMHLAARAGLTGAVATVDHGLRPEAAAEAALVATQARALGFDHEILTWRGDLARQGKGNLPDLARQARRRLLAEWAGRRGLTAVALAHTQDDVAETFLMRLARGAGLDGLSAMAADFQAHGARFVRPMLGFGRAELRAWLADQGLAWVDDPSNADPAYDRTRARLALTALAPLGLGAPRLAEVAAHLAQARQALEAAAEALIGQVVAVEGQGLALRLDRALLAQAPQEVRRRLVLAVLDWCHPAPYAPRAAQVAGLMAGIAAGRVAQLAGVRFLPWRGAYWACAEPSAELDLWRLEGPGGATGAEARALGPRGLAQCPDWRASGLPRAALLGAPALWQGDRLLACPHAGRPAGFRAICLRPPRPTAARILSH